MIARAGAIESYRIFVAASPGMRAAIRGIDRGTGKGGFIPGMPATGKTFAMDAIYLVRISEQG